VRWNEGGELAELIVPAATAPMLALGLLNCGVFVTLETSPRNRSERLPSLPNMMLRTIKRRVALCPARPAYCVPHCQTRIAAAARSMTYCINRDAETIHLGVKGHDERLHNTRPRPFTPAFRPDIAVENPWRHRD